MTPDAPGIVLDVSSKIRNNHQSLRVNSRGRRSIFGDVGLSLFLAGAAFCEILGDSRSAKCCIFPYKMCLQDGTSIRSPKRWVRDDDFIVGLYPRIMLGMSSNRLYIGGSNSEISRSNLELRISWQAQYLVMLDGNQCCSTHCK